MPGRANVNAGGRRGRVSMPGQAAVHVEVMGVLGVVEEPAPTFQNN
jgi:hypothetical protein